MCYPLRAPAPVVQLCPFLSPSLTGSWLLPPPSLAGVLELQEPPETPLRRGVRTGPKALACLGRATPPRPEPLDHSPYKPRPAPPYPSLSAWTTRPTSPAPPAQPRPALSSWTTRPTSPARPTRPSHSAGERVLREAAAAVAAQR